MVKRVCAAAAALIMILTSTVILSSASGENLSLGKSYTITAGEPVELSYANYETNVYGIDGGRLTDGKYASASSSDANWYRAMRGGSRIVTVDLGETVGVASLKAGFLHSKNEAYYIPRLLKVSLSENGTDFMTVCEVRNPFSLSSLDKKRVEYTADFGKTYSARYVRAEFSVDVFACCDEISVFGGENPVSIVPDAPKQTPEKLTSLAGASDYVKIYNGYYPQQEIADNTEKELLPYVAYLDSDGTIKDTLFDGVAFVPCHTDYPSGGRLTKTSGKSGAVMSDWLLYLENTFANGINLDALDKTVGKVYSALNISESFPVLLTLPFPTVLDGKAFGDINGDGKSESCVTLEERVNIVKWYADMCVQRFAEAGYENLTLAGFYWYREEVNYADTDCEDALVKQVNEYVHGLSLKTLFDPFYLATGYDHYEALGFDACVMQPNYAEIASDRKYFKEGMLAEFAETVKNRGVGVEIETLSPSAYTEGSDFEKAAVNYMEYLRTGVENGYAGCLKTYYQGAGPGSFYTFCYADGVSSRGKTLRALYDATYKFIKGTYTLDAPAVETESSVTVESGEKLRGKLTVADGDSLLCELSLEITSKPLHGTLTLSGLNAYVYKPDDGYTGADSFAVAASDSRHKSESVTVNVSVTEKAQTSAPQPESSAPEQSASDDTKKGISPLVPIAAAAVAVAAALLFLYFKKRKGK